MSSLAAIFVHTNTQSTLLQIVDSLKTERSNFGGNLRTAQDIATANALQSAQVLLEHAAQQTDAGIMASYLFEAERYFTFAMSNGYATLVQSPITPQERQMLLQKAESLNLLTVLAEVYLGTLALVQQNRPRALQLLASAYEKALIISQIRPWQYIEVHEEERVFVNGHTGWGKRWLYKGKRPEIGSAARLAQDIDLAYRTARDGSLPSPADVYLPWIKAQEAGRVSK